MSIISLTDDHVYDIGGKTYTLKELREHAIDSHLYREQLRLMAESE